MVPGSTLMYGSNFINVTENPRASRMAPTEEAATPLPSEETTPPVMKMYLVAMNPPPFSESSSSPQDSFHLPQIRRRIHPERPLVDDQHPDGNSVLQRPQLLERF